MNDYLVIKKNIKKIIETDRELAKLLLETINAKLGKKSADHVPNMQALVELNVMLKPLNKEQKQLFATLLDKELEEGNVKK